MKWRPFRRCTSPPCHTPLRKGAPLRCTRQRDQSQSSSTRSYGIFNSFPRILHFLIHCIIYEATPLPASVVCYHLAPHHLLADCPPRRLPRRRAIRLLAFLGKDLLTVPVVCKRILRYRTVYHIADTNKMSKETPVGISRSTAVCCDFEN